MAVEAVSLLFFHLFLVAFGVIWLFFPPGQPNFVFGFRTRRASSSAEAWKYANSLFAKVFLLIAALSLVGQLGLIFVDNNVASAVSAAIAGTTMGLICLWGVWVQVLLCRKFDKSGNAR